MGREAELRAALAGRDRRRLGRPDHLRDPREHGLPVDIEPEHPKMGHLVAAVAAGWRGVGKARQVLVGRAPHAELPTLDEASRRAEHALPRKVPDHASHPPRNRVARTDPDPRCLGPRQELKKKENPPLGPIVESHASSAYRTLTGKVGEIKASDQSLTIEVGSAAEAKPKAKSKAPSQTWLLGVGKQTLLLRAGRNNQFATIELGDVKAGETVQAVVTLQADLSDRSHTAWWLVVYPAGVTPPTR